MKQHGHSTRVVVIAVVASALVCAIQAGAEELKWRQPMHNVKAERVPVGDVPGHFLGVGENSGLAFFDGGEIATSSNQFTFDYTNGSGPHSFYALFTFEDGSTFATKGQGTTTADPGGKTVAFQGTFSFTGGSGRFAGIQGEGRYTGRRLALLPGVGAELYADNVATYTIASR